MILINAQLFFVDAKNRKVDVRLSIYEHGYWMTCYVLEWQIYNGPALGYRAYKGPAAPLFDFENQLALVNALSEDYEKQVKFNYDNKNT